MKTNHLRSFIDPGSDVKDRVGYRTRRLSSKVVYSKLYGDAYYGGHRQAAREKASAKRFLRQAERRDGKREVKLICARPE